ncbi:Uncharacterized protein APZ42_031238 [Daphnia magna]|uniref:Uncharacterized protein n=1 Tax=Daphnia magna TaxID=35525 RepID=A0A164N0R5_9CRUS|nr:Uncharacterized protein APZ42_031238 [Daphnia magna]
MDPLADQTTCRLGRKSLHLVSNLQWPNKRFERKKKKPSSAVKAKVKNTTKCFFVCQKRKTLFRCLVEMV